MTVVRPSEPKCDRCQTPMERYAVPGTGGKEQAWRLACPCQHSTTPDVARTSKENALVEGEKFTTAWLNIDKFPGGMMMSSHGGRFGPVPAMTGCLITTSATTVEEWRLKGMSVIEVQLRNAPETGEGQAPIAKITVRESCAGHYAPDEVTVSLYAPGLPPGAHDVYCEPGDPQDKEQIRHLERRIRELTEQMNCMRLAAHAQKAGEPQCSGLCSGLPDANCPMHGLKATLSEPEQR